MNTTKLTKSEKIFAILTKYNKINKVWNSGELERKQRAALRHRSAFEVDSIFSLYRADATLGDYKYIERCKRLLLAKYKDGQQVGEY